MANGAARTTQVKRGAQRIDGIAQPRAGFELANSKAQNYNDVADPVSGAWQDFSPLTANGSLSIPRIVSLDALDCGGD
jgi:hypothetical protein